MSTSTFAFAGDLTPEVIKRHQKVCGKDVCLVLDLTVLGIPTHNVLLSAPKTVWVSDAMQEVMAKFMSEREVDPAS